MSEVKCTICQWSGHFLVDHIQEEHGLSPKEYDGPFVSEELAELYRNKVRSIRRKAAPPVDELTVQMSQFDVPVHWDVPEEDCLPIPEHYRLPSHGRLGEDIIQALISLISGRNLYIWGMPGSGKDAFVHAYCAKTRTPSVLFKVDPGEDIESWFFIRSFDEKGTSWEEGDMLKCLRDGYVSRSGRRLPYLVLISDVDRATKTQMESLRMVFDSIQSRVKGPGGKTYPTLQGTQVVVTANTSGSGDVRGRNISANPIDASILDRIDRFFQFHWMDWRDEEPIVKNKFPLLTEKQGDIFKHIGIATAVLRNAIERGELYTEFSHRAVCAWLGHAEDTARLHKKTPDNLIRQAARCWLDKMPDPETRQQAINLVSPNIPGGMIDPGDISHMNPDGSYT